MKWVHATSISISKQKHRAVGPALVTIPFDVVHDVFHAAVAQVGVGRRKVAKESGAIDSLPVERVVRKLIEIVPSDLDGHEVVHASVLGELRQLAAVPKRIRQEENLANLSEFAFKKELPVEKLPRHGLAVG